VKCNCLENSEFKNKEEELNFLNSHYLLIYNLKCLLIIKMIKDICHK